MASGHWHSTVPPDLRELCEAACKHAPRQLDALMLKSQGCGPKRIGRILGITEQAASGLLARAELNIRQEQAARQGYR